ncbi:MAG: hypothetical protein ABMA25_21475, partial [Ilumatobacteraceae bacterium]
SVAGGAVTGGLVTGGLVAGGLVDGVVDEALVGSDAAEAEVSGSTDPAPGATEGVASSSLGGAAIPAITTRRISAAEAMNHQRRHSGFFGVGAAPPACMTCE